MTLPKIKLIDQKNNVYDSVNNKVYKLIYFGYTYCPDVCPFDILKLSRLFKENPKLKKYIEPIFITVDPERDSVEVMRNFLVNFDEGIIGLTGSIEEITEAYKAGLIEDSNMCYNLKWMQKNSLAGV